MRGETEVALREWAVLCDWLADGVGVVLLRTGGIHEAAFDVDRREFWLCPTYLHAAREHLAPAERARYDRVAASAPAEGLARLELYARVVDAVFVEDVRVLARLEPLHPYDPAYVRQRFDFREPGLWALTLRVHRLPVAVERPLGPEHGGCVSWIRFDPPLSTAGLVPVMRDEAFDRRRRAVAQALGQDPS